MNLDPEGLVSWNQSARDATTAHPLSLQSPASSKPVDILPIVKKICEKFKNLVEHNRHYKLFYKDPKCTKPKLEEATQLYFYALADSYCEANNLNLSRESNGGRGPVDFKMSRDYKPCVLVEIKKSANSKLTQAYTTQVPIYEKAEKAGKSIILVIRVHEGMKQISALKELEKARREAGLEGPEVIVVDARPVDSASHTKEEFEDEEEFDDEV